MSAETDIGSRHNGQEIAVASAAVVRSRDAVDSKLRAVRSTCRGIYSPKSLPLVGVAGLFPRGAARLSRFGLTVRSNLEMRDLGLEPQIELDLGDGVPPPTAQLAGQLDGRPVFAPPAPEDPAPGTPQGQAPSEAPPQEATA